MARTVRSPKLDTRSARVKLKPRREPYWAAIAPGRHLGYRRLGSHGGTWIAKLRLGAGRWTKALGPADDALEANGAVLSFAQAQELARAWLVEQERVVTEPGAVAPAAPSTVAEACRIYVADLRARKGDQAARSTELRLQRHLLPALGDRRLADLTAPDLRAWRNALVRAGDPNEVRTSQDTANRMLGIAKAVFNLAFRDGKVDSDLAWRRVPAFEDVGRSRLVILSDDELQRLIDACEPALRDLVVVGAETGARLGELKSATVRALDVAGAVLQLSGKTGEREICLVPSTVQLLRQLAAGKRPDEPLFRMPPSGGPWRGSRHAAPFARAVERAGLDPATTFYALRHSYISRALVAGVPIKAVADHCGTSVVMIDQYYGKFVQNDRVRYAALAAPRLRAAPAEKVIPLKR